MPDTTPKQKSSQQAQSLIEAKLESTILYPDDAKYESRIDSYWCNSAKLRPACIFQPRTASEVAAGVKALAAAKQVFAVRSGGHSNYADSNNVADGVTIDLGLLNEITYDSKTEVASIGPAAKWIEVIRELEKHGRVVAGGREAEVGVGGLLLGGGNTFFTGRQGFACDNVVAYEIALADGSIIMADADGQHSDLFRALKGGSNNFGVVTLYKMRTLPSEPIWSGYAVKPIDIMPNAAEALVEFTANTAADPDSSLNFTMAHMPRVGGAAVVTICTNVANVANPPALEKIQKLPELMNNFKTTTLIEVLPYASLPPGYFNVWYTLTIKNDASIVTKASELYNELASQVQAQVTDGDFTTHLSFQPIPKLFAERSAAFGGNMLGLERYGHNAIMLQVNASVRTRELADWALPRVRAVVEGITAFASNVEDGICPWLHLNYANPEQKVLESYGEENVRKLRQAAAKYDPAGVFQRLCKGAYKISLVGG